MSVFETLNKINVNDKTEVKDTGKVKLTYLSWAFAWAEAKKLYPNLKVTVFENEQGLPYFLSEQGIMVKVSVEIEETSHTVYLPVMDGANNAMKSEEYEVKTKYNTRTVKAANMMDINKTIQRATVKALGLHGLGLYIYAGEDLPEDEAGDTEKKTKKTSKAATEVKVDKPKTEGKRKSFSDYTETKKSEPEVVQEYNSGDDL